MPVLERFARRHAESRSPLARWQQIVENAQWRTPNDVKAVFGANVDFVGHLAIFDIGGNKYRLRAEIRYAAQAVFIRDVLTHQEHDRKE